MTVSITFSVLAQDDTKAAPVPKPRMRMDSVLASVNGEAVTLLDVLLESIRTERELAGMFSGERLYSETARIRKEVLENIIERKLIYQEYKLAPFEIPIQEVENMLDSMAADMGAADRVALEKRALQYGTDMNTLREKAKEKLAVEIMLAIHCDKFAIVSPKDIYDEYKAHPELWAEPATISLSLLQIKRGQGKTDAEIDAVSEKLVTVLSKAAAVDFEKAVKEYSDSNEPGGMTSTKTERAKLRPEFAEAVKNAKLDDIVGPVKTPEAVYFIRITDIKDSEFIPFSKASPEIKARLMMMRTAEKRALYIKKLRDKAFVRYLI